MTDIELERDYRQEPWEWVHQQRKLPPVQYAPPLPMSGQERMAFLEKLTKNVREQYRRRPLTELAAKAILAEKGMR